MPSLTDADKSTIASGYFRSARSWAFAHRGLLYSLLSKLRITWSFYQIASVCTSILGQPLPDSHSSPPCLFPRTSRGP